MQIRATQSRVEELQAIADGAEPPPPSSWLGRLPLADWVYRRMMCLHLSPAAAAAAAREQLVTLRSELTAAEAAPLARASNSCIVVFNFERHASAAIRDLHWERGLFSAKYDGPRMKMEAGGGSDVRGGSPGGLPRVAAIVHEVLKQRDAGEVRSARAPEASDIVWENMLDEPRVSVARYIKVWAVCVVALGVSVGVLFLLATLSEKSRQARLYCTAETKNDDGTFPEGCEAEGVRPPPRPSVHGLRPRQEICAAADVRARMQSMTVDVGMDVSRRTLLAAAQGLTVAAINSAVTLLLQVVQPLEKHHLHTEALASTTVKLTVFYLLNSVAVPIGARYITAGSDWNWCAHMHAQPCTCGEPPKPGIVRPTHAKRHPHTASRCVAFPLLCSGRRRGGCAGAPLCRIMHASADLAIVALSCSGPCDPCRVLCCCTAAAAVCARVPAQLARSCFQPSSRESQLAHVPARLLWDA